MKVLDAAMRSLTEVKLPRRMARRKSEQSALD
jgi:hypothetical protein